MSLKALGLIVAIALLIPSENAAAALVTATVGGTVALGSDFPGAFGGGDLSGDAFTATFSFDPDLAQSRTTTSTSDTAAGATPAGSVSLTIDGRGLTINGPVYAQINSSPDSSEYFLQLYTVGNSSNYLITNIVQLPNGVTLSLDAPLSVVGMYPTFTDFSNSSGDQILIGSQTLDVVVSSASVSAVPLPASLPMFASALLGIAGFGLWRQRRSSGAVAAAA